MKAVVLHPVSVSVPFGGGHFTTNLAYAGSLATKILPGLRDSYQKPKTRSLCFSREGTRQGWPGHALQSRRTTSE